MENINIKDAGIIIYSKTPAAPKGNRKIIMVNRFFMNFVAYKCTLFHLR